MRTLPSKHSESSRLCRASQSVYAHYGIRKVPTRWKTPCFVAAIGGTLRATPSKPSRASVSLKRRVALRVTSGSFAFKMPSQNLTQNFL